MAFTVADGLIRLLVDEKELQRAVTASGGPAAVAADQAGATVGSRFGNALQKTAITVAAATGGLVARSIGKATDFDEQLRVINTVAKVSDETLHGIGESILAVSRETGKATDDLTAGFYDLVSAGVPAEKAIAVLKTSAVLATGALGTTGEAVDLLTSSLNAYGLSADQATRVSDIFAQAVADGKVTVAELGSTIANIAPIAASAGIKLEEVAAGFAVMTAKGTPAAQAATQMRAAISALLTPNAQLNELSKQTGINFAELAKEKGLSAALEAVRKATNGNDEAFAKALGSVEGYQFALQATGDNAGAFAAEQAKITAGADQGGVAMSQYEEVMKSAAAQGRKLTAELASAAITIGGPFVSSLGGVLSALGPMGQGLAGVAAAGGLVKTVVELMSISNLKNAASWLVALPAMVANNAALLLYNATGIAAAAVSTGMSIAMGIATVATTALGIAVNFLLSPIGLIVLAVAALFVAWQTNFLGIRDIVGTVVDFLVKTFGFLIEPIKAVMGLIGGVLDFVGKAVDGIHDFLFGSEDAVAKSGERMKRTTGRLKDDVAADLAPPRIRDDWYNEMGAATNAVASSAPAMAGAVQQVTDQIPRGIEKSSIMAANAARAWLALPIGEQLMRIGPVGLRAGSEVSLKLAAGLRQKRSDIDAAISQLKTDMENKLSPTKEVAKRIGQLFGHTLSAGLRSSDPVVKAQAEGTRALIEAQLIETIKAGGKAGEKIQEELEKKLKSKDPAVKAQAQRTKSLIDAALKDQPAKTPGEKIATDLATDIGKGNGAVGRAAYQLGLTVARNVLRGVAGTGVSVPSSGSPTGRHNSGPQEYAEGTDFVPSDGLAYLHKGEIVVPRRESEAIRSGAGASIGNVFDSLGRAPDVTLVMPDARNRDPFDVLERARRLAGFGAFSSPRVSTVAPGG